MTTEQIIILIILYVSNCFDSLRDSMLRELYVRKWTPKQWRWHVCKWVSMFSIWGFISIKFFDGNYGIKNFTIFIIFAIFCNISWKEIYLRK